MVNRYRVVVGTLYRSTTDEVDEVHRVVERLVLADHGYW